MVLALGALLPPSAFGTVAVGVTIVGIGNVLVTSGTGGSLVVMRGLTRANVRQTMRVNVELGLVVSTPACLLGAPIVHLFAPGGT
jgi:O-antigen/teichoic acid export membrane protein